MPERVEIVSDHIILPTGATLDDWDNARDFAVHVVWRGPRTESGRGGWAVTRRGDVLHLSRAGNWAWQPPPFRQRQYRWATFEEALAAAREHVDDPMQMGRFWTWAEYVAWARRT